MKRLTQKHYGASDYYMMSCSENCAENVDCIDCPSFDSLVDRLGAYENTGLTPDGVESLKLSMMGKAVAEITEIDGLPIDRLKELAAADREGNVVVLPCRVGRRVYVPDFETQTVANIRVQGISITPAGRVVLHFGGYPAVSAWGDRCGIDWFLTCEGAEAALRRAER